MKLKTKRICVCGWDRLLDMVTIVVMKMRCCVVVMVGNGGNSGQ